MNVKKLNNLISPIHKDLTKRLNDKNLTETLCNMLFDAVAEGSEDGQTHFTPNDMQRISMYLFEVNSRVPGLKSISKARKLFKKEILDMFLIS